MLGLYGKKVLPARRLLSGLIDEYLTKGKIDGIINYKQKRKENPNERN